jgi:hypothetical protein
VDRSLLQDPLELECLQGFDHARFGVLARSLQVLLGHGAVDYAIDAVRQFAQATRRQPASLGSQLVDVLPVRIANALEEIGCTTAAAFLKLSDGEICSVPGLGEQTIAMREQLRLEIASGVRLEECGGDEELEFDFLADCPREVLDYVEGRMSQSDTKEVSVLDALKVIAERGTEAVAAIDRKLIELEAEVASLKKMKAMLMPATPRKPARLADKYIPIADGMFEHLKGGVSAMPGKIAVQVQSSAIIVGKIAKEDKRFMRYSDGRIGLA